MPDTKDSEGMVFIEANSDLIPTDEECRADPSSSAKTVALAADWGASVLDLLERIAIALEKPHAKEG